MRSLVLATTALLCLPALALADAPRFTLEQVIARAQASPKAQMADGDRDAAAARVAEADAARWARLKATAFATLSPEIHCDNIDCTQTSPQNFAFRFDGLFASAQFEATQPIYTFGKIAHSRAAARAGLDAQQALADEAAGDLAVDAARAYWGVKLARELGYMLDDGIDEIAKALQQLTDKADVTVQDRQRIAVLLATAKAQRADAASAENQALAGLRVLVGVPDADVDQDPLAAVVKDVPKLATGDNRPQALAAKRGATAADELAIVAERAYFPDVALVATGVIAGAQGADDPPSTFANDPYNRSGLALVVALSWTVEPWTTKAKADRARAEAHKARAQSDLAAMGASFDAQTALAEASGAHDKVAATTDGEKAARTWLASVLQAQAIGTAESKDLADAYIAWFQMRAQWAQAVFQWNVSVVRLGRAAGEFRAPASRPKE